MAACLICKNPIEPFISFGRQPIANGFLTPDQFASEYFFDLKVAFCNICKMVQLTELVDRERMFHDHYAFFSSTSTRMAEHFREFASWIRSDHIIAPDPFVVEIGSNDGIMLRHFAQAGIRHLGIEPSVNVAAVARENGVRTISEFFDERLARRIVDENGQADAFIAANVMCHIPYIHSVVEGIRILLKPTGVVAFEDPYLGDVIQKTSYDQIYDEHAFLFSATSIGNLFGQHGLELVDVLPQETHGGSMRYVIAHRGTRPASDRVIAQREFEDQLGLGRPETYDRFRQNCERSRDELMSLLRRTKREGRRVVGYAATSKSTTVTNYCGITPDLVEFISDTTPIKHGTYSPGVHIPVRPYDEFARDYPDLALLFGWNHAEEIMAKEQRFRDAGGKWIVYVPRVQVVA
jgi:methylation protein EvaC